MTTRFDPILRWRTIAAACFPLIAFAPQPDAPKGMRDDALPMKLAQSMLWIADASAGDVGYDLGCAGVADAIEFRSGNLRATPIVDTIVVMRLLSPAQNLELLPKLLRELKQAWFKNYSVA
jgi:hypothetical protein